MREAVNLYNIPPAKRSIGRQPTPKWTQVSRIARRRAHRTLFGMGNELCAEKTIRSFENEPSSTLQTENIAHLQVEGGDIQDGKHERLRPCTTTILGALNTL